MTTTPSVDPCRHVLVINNDKDVLSLFNDLLQEAGYRVSTRSYTERDLTAIRGLRADLIILDYMWSDADAGWSLLQMLLMDRVTSTIPIVLCTAAVREVADMREHLTEMGIQVVLKPFRVEQMLEAVALAVASINERDAAHVAA